MTTRILSSRALRLIVASLLVYAAPFVPRTSITVVLLESAALMTLAWFIVPGDRRWFVPASLLMVAAGLFWPLFATARYQLGDGSQIVVSRLTGRVDLLPPQRVRNTTDWYRLHRSGGVRLMPVLRPSLLGYLGITRAKRTPAADSVAVAVPPVPPDMAVNGGCIRSTNGGKWVPCPDVEYLPIWPGQHVVSKDTIAVDRLPGGRCAWESSTLKAPPNGLAVTIGERHPKTCRAVVYDIEINTPPWIPPQSIQ